MSPKALRGAFVSCYQVMITLGILIAYIVDYGTRNINGAAAYKIPIGLQVIWGAMLCIGTPFLPVSPRQSILRGDTEKARDVIARMHGIPMDDPLVQAYIDEISAKIEEEKHSGAGYLDCFNFSNDLKTGQRTLIGCGVQSFQQLTGANFIFVSLIPFLSIASAKVIYSTTAHLSLALSTPPSTPTSLRSSSVSSICSVHSPVSTASTASAADGQ